MGEAGKTLFNDLFSTHLRFSYPRRVFLLRPPLLKSYLEGEIETEKTKRDKDRKKREKKKRKESLFLMFVEVAFNSPPLSIQHPLLRMRNLLKSKFKLLMSLLKVREMRDATTTREGKEGVEG